MLESVFFIKLDYFKGGLCPKNREERKFGKNKGWIVPEKWRGVKVR